MNQCGVMENWNFRKRKTRKLNQIIVIILNLVYSEIYRKFDYQIVMEKGLHWLLWIISPSRSEYSIFIFTLSRGIDEGQARQRLKNVPIIRQNFYRLWNLSKIILPSVGQGRVFNSFICFERSLKCLNPAQKLSRMLAQFFPLFHFWAETIDFSLRIELQYFVEYPLNLLSIWTIITL